MADQTLPIHGTLDLTPPHEGESTWLDTLHSWVITVDHKKLGLMYMMLSIFFLLVGGVEVLLIRIQLMVPDNHFISPQAFNRLFTMHGTTMVFLVGMPLVFAWSNYLIPLQIGARDMAYPRLNAFSFWLTFFGALLLYYSFIGGPGLYGVGSAPDVTWWAYAPLTAKAFSPGHATDYWALALIVTGFGTLGGAINIIATAISMRCKGMTLMRMPLLTWLMVVDSGLLLVTITPLTAAQIMLLLDRYLGAHFFDTQAGGQAILWMHFFWIFGHPEVYVLVFPAFGIASEVIPVFSRKAIFGYPAMVAASVGIGFVSLGVWAHHMFTVGMTSAGNAFFVLSTGLVGVPTGIKIFNWIATMWGGKIRFHTAMLFCTAFVFQFLAAGLTGIMLSVAPWNWQLHSSYFVIAHFHYVLVGAIVFNVFAGIY
jgi:cytochrome c oxidase subunit 1